MFCLQMHGSLPQLTTTTTSFRPILPLFLAVPVRVGWAAGLALWQAGGGSSASPSAKQTAVLVISPGLLRV